jgi:hypothetical protein
MDRVSKRSSELYIISIKIKSGKQWEKDIFVSQLGERYCKITKYGLFQKDCCLISNIAIAIS